MYELYNSFVINLRVAMCYITVRVEACIQSIIAIIITVNGRMTIFQPKIFHIPLFSRVEYYHSLIIFQGIFLITLSSWLSIPYSCFCLCFIEIFRILYIFQVNIQYSWDFQVRYSIFNTPKIFKYDIQYSIFLRFSSTIFNIQYS